MDFGVYIHVPFCTVQCPYCTFYTVARPTAEGGMRRFVAAVRREWQLRVAPRLEAGDHLRTLYLGGGTPSDLPPDALVKLLRECGADVQGGLAALDEVTVECNPESAAPSLLDELQSAGVGRASLGVQALDDGDLAALGRGSRSAENRAALAAVAARFPTWNADLILGIPGSNRQRLERALVELVEAGTPHLSFYCLELPKERARRVGDPQTEVSEAWKAELYEWTSAWVGTRGYVHYEISNAARPGHEAVHNTAYWQGREYVGLGPGAHSFAVGERRANRPDLGAYLEALEAGREPPAGRERLSEAMRHRERVLLGLRQRQGLKLSELGEGLPAGFLDRLQSDGLAILGAGRIRLTPRGWLVSDTIVLKLVTA
jgi:oxygen-independent coproporphyrinogen-3 oxidase